MVSCHGWIGCSGCREGEAKSPEWASACEDYSGHTMRLARDSEGGLKPGLDSGGGGGGVSGI